MRIILALMLAVALGSIALGAPDDNSGQVIKSINGSAFLVFVEQSEDLQSEVTNALLITNSTANIRAGEWVYFDIISEVKGGWKAAIFSQIGEAPAKVGPQRGG